MRTVRIIAFVFFLLLSACAKFPNSVAIPTATSTRVISTATPGISPQAAQYLNNALDIMQSYSLNKHEIDWPAFRAGILSQAASARTPADTYPFIKTALARLNDHHGFFMDPQEASAQVNGTSPTPMPPEINLVENRFGYVVIRSYTGLNQEAVNQYGTDMQKQIQAIDRLHPCGWIVDLRGNAGGNMWPMLIGIGPVLGEGQAGSFVDADGRQVEWAYAGGQGWFGPQAVSTVTAEPYHLANPDAPVAVLFGDHTASAGEILAVSFVGRLNARSFGSKSAGYTTITTGYPLSDNAGLFLTTNVIADRTGKVYGGAVIPDVQVNGATSDPGPIPQEALQWLADQPACH
jgi:carboxyl-terminal processing protease